MTENISVATVYCNSILFQPDNYCYFTQEQKQNTTEHCLNFHCFVKEFFHVRALQYEIHGHPSLNPMTNSNFK